MNQLHDWLIPILEVHDLGLEGDIGIPPMLSKSASGSHWITFYHTSH